MGRVKQSVGERGSLKWIQKAINQAAPRTLVELILLKLKGARIITWSSPISSDDYAEYRDAAFLEKIGASDLTADLSKFWPSRGPQWDALGRSDKDDVLLVEAKAHIAEICSSPSDAGPASRRKSKRRLLRLHAIWAQSPVQNGQIFSTN